MKTKDKEMENIPEKFLNTDGTLNSDALIKSYNELEKKIGTMITSPNDDSDTNTRQKFNRAIGVPANASEYPSNDLYDDEKLREKFLDIGLTFNQVEKIYDIANEYLSPILRDIFSINAETKKLNELKNYFGDTEKMNDALRAIKIFGERYLPHDAFEVLCSTPQGIQGIHKMMRSMGPNVHTEQNSIQNLTDAQLRTMMRDPKYWRDNDADYIRKIENGFKKLYS